jgi:nucleoside-diphosphate-sugar epimerase
MKIFVTGGTGVVGTRAVPALVAAGHDVTAVARGAAKADLVRSFGGAPVEVDLFDPDAVRAAVVGHEAVVHLATQIPPLSKATRRHAWDTNDGLRRVASEHLVDAALATGASRYVQESICFPYRDGGDRWLDEDAPWDHDPPAFSGAAVAEGNAARFAEEGGGTGVVLRFAQFYSSDSSHVVAFNRAVRWHVNPFFGASDAYASFIHAEDAGSAVVAALVAPTGTYNVADDEPLTRADAGAAVAAALGRHRPVTIPRWLQARAPKAARALSASQRVSNARFKAATGWSPAHPSIRGSWPARAVPR